MGLQGLYLFIQVHIGLGLLECRVNYWRASCRHLIRKLEGLHRNAHFCNKILTIARERQAVLGESQSLVRFSRHAMLRIRMLSGEEVAVSDTRNPHRDSDSRMLLIGAPKKVHT